MKIHDCHNELTSFELLPSASQGAGTVNGTCVDISQYQGIIKCHLNGASGGTGALNVKIQTGDQSDGSDAADLSGAAFTQITTTGGNLSIGVDTRACKKYIRAVSVVTTGPQVRSCIAVGQKQVI